MDQPLSPGCPEAPDTTVCTHLYVLLCRPPSSAHEKDWGGAGDQRVPIGGTSGQEVMSCCWGTDTLLSSRTLLEQKPEVERKGPHTLLLPGPCLSLGAAVALVRVTRRRLIAFGGIAEAKGTCPWPAADA